MFTHNQSLAIDSSIMYNNKLHELDWIPYFIYISKVSWHSMTVILDVSFIDLIWNTMKITFLILEAYQIPKCYAAHKLHWGNESTIKYLNIQIHWHIVKYLRLSSYFIPLFHYIFLLTFLHIVRVILFSMSLLICDNIQRLLYLVIYL